MTWCGSSAAVEGKPHHSLSVQTIVPRGSLFLHSFCSRIFRSPSCTGCPPWPHKLWPQQPGGEEFLIFSGQCSWTSGPCPSQHRVGGEGLVHLVPDISLPYCIPIAMALAFVCKSMCHFWTVAHVQRFPCPHYCSMLKAEEKLHVHKLLHAKS